MQACLNPAQVSSQVCSFAEVDLLNSSLSNPEFVHHRNLWPHKWKVLMVCLFGNFYSDPCWLYTFLTSLLQPAFQLCSLVSCLQGTWSNVAGRGWLEWRSQHKSGPDRCHWKPRCVGLKWQKEKLFSTTWQDRSWGNFSCCWNVYWTARLAHPVTAGAGLKNSLYCRTQWKISSHIPSDDFSVSKNCVFSAVEDSWNWNIATEIIMM